MKLKDKFWIWGHEAGAHNHLIRGTIGSESRMTATEAAFYLGVRNALMVRYWGKPEPPFDQEALALSPLKQVIWSIVGCSPGMPETYMEDLDEVLQLAQKFPNITGGILDDFFVDDREEERRKRYPPVEIAKTRERMHQNPGAPLDLWVVLYEYQLDKDIGPELREFDGVTFWTWYGSALRDFDRNYQKYRRLAGENKRTLLGCYLYDYGEGKLFHAEEMEYQLEQYRQLVISGEVEGVILLSNTVADLGLEAVEYVREWLRVHGDEEVFVRA